MLNNNQGGGIDLTGTRSFAQFGGAAGVQQNANAGFQMGGALRSPRWPAMRPALVLWQAAANVSARGDGS